MPRPSFFYFIHGLQNNWCPSILLWGVWLVLERNSKQINLGPYFSKTLKCEYLKIEPSPSLFLTQKLSSIRNAYVFGVRYFNKLWRVTLHLGSEIIYLAFLLTFITKIVATKLKRRVNAHFVIALRIHFWKKGN